MISLSAELSALGVGEEAYLLLAVSGGKDSMAMLHLAQKTLPNPLGVVHFNHQSRGAESQGEENLVRDYCQKQGIRCFVGTAPVKEIAQKEKQGFEAMARKLRYDYFEEILDAEGADYLLTAHHALDNLETFLFRLARGTGTQGLCGIPPQRGRYLRPLLSLDPAEIRDYVAKEGIPYGEDSSNGEDVYQRNFIRHHLIPLFPQLNGQYLAHSVNTIRIIREENNFLDCVVAEALPLTPVPGGMACSREAFLKLNPALQGRGIQYLVGAVDKFSTLSQKQREGAVCLAKSFSPSGELFLNHLLLLSRSYDTIKCTAVSEETKPLPRPLPLGEEILWGRWRIVVKAEIKRKETKESDGFYLHGSPPFHLRGREEGDRFRPWQRPEKSVKKWMIDEKIPRSLREQLPLILDDKGRIVAVYPLGGAGPCPVGALLWRVTLSKSALE